MARTPKKTTVKYKPRVNKVIQYFAHCAESGDNIDLNDDKNLEEVKKDVAKYLRHASSDEVIIYAAILKATPKTVQADFIPI
jgi:PDZ domain-containing secreted protein